MRIEISLKESLAVHSKCKIEKHSVEANCRRRMQVGISHQQGCAVEGKMSKCNSNLSKMYNFDNDSDFHKISISVSQLFNIK